MKELDVVRIKKSVPHEKIDALSDYDPDLELSGTVRAGDIGTIVHEHTEYAFIVEFGVERGESLLVDCKAEDLELMIEFEEGGHPQHDERQSLCSCLSSPIALHNTGYAAFLLSARRGANPGVNR